MTDDYLGSATPLYLFLLETPSRFVIDTCARLVLCALHDGHHIEHTLCKSSSTLQTVAHRKQKWELISRSGHPVDDGGVWRDDTATEWDAGTAKSIPIIDDIITSHNHTWDSLLA